jgi:hypothetical protein
MFTRGHPRAHEKSSVCGSLLIDTLQSRIDGLQGTVSRSREVKIALVLHKLRDGDVLQCNAVMGIGRDQRVAIPIIMYGCQQSLDIRKYRVIDFNHIRIGVEIRNGFVAEVSRKYESVAGSSAGPCGRCGRRRGHRAGLRTVAGGTTGYCLRGCCYDVACETGVRRSIRGRGGGWLIIARGIRGRVEHIGRGQIGESRADPGGILCQVPSRMCVIAGKSEAHRLLRGGVAHYKRGIAILEEGRRYCHVPVGKGEVLELNGIVRP